jgi:hypothetical protein
MRLLFYLLFSFGSTFTIAQTIGGKVLDLATNKPLPKAVAYLLDTTAIEHTLITEPNNYYYDGAWAHRILEKVNVDSNGLFSFLVAEDKYFTLGISHRMPYFYIGNDKSDSFFLYREAFAHNISLKNGNKYFEIFQLMVTCPYDQTKKQAFCPKCKKRDKVLPIIFGLEIPIFDKNGKIDRKSSRKHYSGGCMVDSYCNPSKRCSRCNKDF